LRRSETAATGRDA